MRVTRRIQMAAFGATLALASLGGGAAMAHADNTAVQHPDYVGPDVVVQGEVVTQAPVVSPETAVSPAQATVGSLPITGGDAAGLAAAGLGMLGVGAVLVRRSRRTA